MHQPPVARSTGGLFSPTGITLHKRGFLLWTNSRKTIIANSKDRKTLGMHAAAGSNRCPGATTSRSHSNIRLHPSKPIGSGVGTLNGGIRIVTSPGLYVPKEETWVDGSTYTVCRCSATQFTQVALTDGGDPVMASRTYGLSAMAEALGAIVPSTSQKRGHNGI